MEVLGSCCLLFEVMPFRERIMHEKVQIKPVTINHDFCGTDYNASFDKEINAGFFDLSIEQFMEIQQALLLPQLQRITHCRLGRRLIGKNIPASVDEFRNSVPLTRYDDYLPDLKQGNEDSLPEKSYVRVHTSDASSSLKRVPYTRAFYNKQLGILMTVFAVACCKDNGQSSLAKGDRVLFNVAPSPYLSGILASGASDRFNLRSIMPPDLHDNMDFKEKVARGFELSLQSGVDILIAMTSVLVKMGNSSSRNSKKGSLLKYSLSPTVQYRFARAFLRSRLEKRNILPKDLWPVKALIGWGIDTNIYRERVHEYWGMYPYEFHACTEAGIMAMQNWNKKDLTFIPDSNFFEFIPESEWLESKKNRYYQPRSVLLSEVKPGERYELVITSFYGMPFVRYRLGHLVRITSLHDDEAQVYLPQMVFEARADDLIDIAGFTRISEKTVAQAIANTDLNHEDWTIRKEVKQDKPTLHLYIELDGGSKSAEIASLLHGELKNIDRFYSDLNSMMDIHPLEVTLLRPGTFTDYYTEKMGAGAELSRRKPPRINAPDDVIKELVRLSSREAVDTKIAV